MAAPITREGLGREAWNEYQRDRRARLAKLRPPRPQLDCSRPTKELFALDPAAYFAQLQRFRRAYEKEHGKPPPSIRKPRPGLDYSKPPRSLFHSDPNAYKAQAQRYWRSKRWKVQKP